MTYWDAAARLASHTRTAIHSLFGWLRSGAIRWLEEHVQHMDLMEIRRFQFSIPSANSSSRLPLEVSPAKLRLAFEAAPFGRLVEMAGGKTSDGVAGFDGLWVPTCFPFWCNSLLAVLCYSFS